MIDIDGRHARFTLTRAFACSPHELFRWLTEPARIRHWSLADVAMRGPFVVGAERTVTLRVGPVRVQRLVERIIAVEPGRGFAYLGLSVAGHRGEVRLRRVRLGSEVQWDAAFEAPHPMLAWPAARFVSQQLSESFVRLTQRLTTSAVAQPPP